MKNKKSIKGFVGHADGPKVSNNKSDSIGLDHQKLRGSEEEELTPS